MTLEHGADVPDLILEQYRLGELPDDESERIARLIRDDPRLCERLQALEASEDAIAARYPAALLAGRATRYPEVQQRARRPRRMGMRGLVVASALAGGAVAIVVALPWRATAPTPDEDRVKGLSPSLSVYRRTAEGSETLADGAPAHAGDLLRVGYVSAGRAYGVILSIDGRGIVTRHLPPSGGRAAALRKGGTILLDQAYELDDAPAFERFYFVTADQPFDVEPILDAARRAARANRRSPPSALPIARELGQSTFSLQKEVRP